MKRTLLSLGMLALATTTFAAASYESALAQALRGYRSHHEVPVDVVRTIANDYGRTFSSVFRDLQFIEEQRQIQREPAPVAPEPMPVRAPAYEPTPARPAGGAPSEYTATDDLLPPNPQPGHCYARVLVPAAYTTEYRQVLKAQGAERVAIQPARYETVEQSVLVQEASTRYEVVDPVYEWVTETVEVRPASTKLVEVPATYKSVSEKVVDVEEHQVWKKGTGAFEKLSNATGEIMCLVTVPATYKTITKSVMVSPASVKEVKIPAEYKTVKRKVLKSEGKVVPVEVPAKYESVKVTRMVAPPTYDRSVQPDEFQNVSYKTLVRPAQMEWREILCETNVDVNTIAKLQRALTAEGYDAGPADGKLGAQSTAALVKFQKDNGLASGNITYETLRALGMKSKGGSLID